MTDEWRIMPFEQAVEINPSIPLVQGELYLFVDMQAIEPSSRTVGPSEFRVFTGSGSRFQNGDTLMARITPCLENGKIARFYSSEDLPCGHGSTEFIVIRGREGVTDNDFAYYLTRSELVRGYAISQMTGMSGRQRVPVSALSHLNVPVPSLPEQRAIAHILGTLDDKIELNRRMNATLEAIARAIFQSWFVDFDPVHAKARGEQPSGMDAETAALFPNSFEELELGLIPRGWRVGALDDVIEITSGKTPKTSSTTEYRDGDIYWFSVKDVPLDEDVFVIETERMITQADIENSSAKILPEGTSIVTARGTVGKLAFVGVPMAINQSCFGIRGIEKDSDYYTFFLLKSVVGTLQKYAHGTIFDEITRKTFSAIRVIIPPVEIIQAFDILIEPFLEQIKHNLFKSRTLSVLRDTLLLKLISGEVRVRDIEGIVAESE